MFFSIVKVNYWWHHLCLCSIFAVAAASHHFSLALFVSGDTSAEVNAIVRAEYAERGVADPYQYQLLCVALQIDPAICRMRQAVTGSPNAKQLVVRAMAT